jgi:cobalt/nickel transport system ATP-binding protein
MAESIIKLSQVSYDYYGKIPAVSGASLKVETQDRFAIIGANGTGKTTLLQIMAGLIHPSGGEVAFRGREVSKETLKDRSFVRFFRERVGYVFQDSDVQLFCPTVLDELLYGPLQLEIDQKEALYRAFQVMQMLNMEELKDRPCHMLSGGEKKKVAIGSVLTINPEVLLLDEPTNGLDPKTQCFLFELMLALNEAGKTIVVATHDLTLVDEMQAKVAVLSEEHRIEKIGEVGEILGDQDLLLRVNLIHEHVHRHGATTHKHIHSHYLFHRHEDLKPTGPK